MRIFHSCTRIILILILFVSCAEIQFPEFEIENCNFNSDFIEITFSDEPNQYLLIKNFSITEDSDEITGKFCFNGKTVKFFPDDGIKDDYIYELTITSSVENLNGISLDEDYKTKYSTRCEYDRPNILQISPAHESQSSTNISSIKITFSESIDDISFRNAISFSPSFDYTYSWESNNSIVNIYPTTVLSRDTRYEIRISTELMDFHRNTLLNEFKSTFVNYVDIDTPTLTLSYDVNGTPQTLIENTTNQNLKTDEKLTLDFSEQINIEYVSSYIEIYPPLNITITPDKNLKSCATITFNGDMVWGDTYSLTILHGLKDLAGNEIQDDYCFDLMFDNEDNRPVKVKKILIDLKDSDYSEFNNFEYLSFDPNNFPTSGSETISTNIFCIFDISKNANNIMIFSVMENFSLDYSNSCFESFEIKKVKLLDNIEIEGDSKLKNYYDLITDNEGQKCVIQIGVEILNSSKIGTLSISLDKNIKDSLNNTMNDDYFCRVNKI